jgi:hypothetical protein
MYHILHMYPEVYLVGYILCIIDCHMYPEVSFSSNLLYSIYSSREAQ